MKIVHAASELFPYMKTGGLADAVGALTATFADRGHEVAAFLPGYRDAVAHPMASGAERKFRLKIEMGDHYLSGDILSFSPRKNLTVYLVCREEFFDRRSAYGNGERDYDDNAERFTFFCKAVLGRTSCTRTTGRRRCSRSSFASPSAGSGSRSR
jgi:starch synthase